MIKLVRVVGINTLELSTGANFDLSEAHLPSINVKQ